MRPDLFLATIGRGSNGSNALEVTEDRAAVTAESQDNIINRVNNVSQYGPSWHYVPGIGVAGTAYAEVPSSALGDLAFSRASSKTRTNSSGVVQTIASNVPPHDYRNADGSLSTFPRLNLEPQRTNSFLRSEEFDNASWSNTGSTVIANDTTSPSGIQNADRITTTGGLQIINQSPSLTVGQAFVFSVFAKAGNWGIVRVGNVSSATSGAWFNVSNGTTGTINGGTSEIINYGNGWYRLIARFTSFATGSSFIGISDANGSTTAPAVGSFMYLWGAQIEAGSFVSSYIPTTTAAVTRLADAASDTTATTLIGQTEGTLFLELNTNRTGLNQHIELGDGTTNNRITVRFTSSNTFQLVIIQGAAVVYNQTSATTFAQGQRIKIAAAYKSGAATNIYVNGVSVTSATAGTITGNLTGIYTTSFGAGATDPLFSPLTEAALIKTRLTNAQLAQLTTL